MYLNVVRDSLAGTVVRSAQKGIKQLYEFKRIRCTICLTSPDNHQKKESPNLESACLPATFLLVMFHFQRWSCSDRKKTFLVVPVPRVHKGQREPQDITKWLINERPSVSLYLDELPIEKCQFRNPVSRQSP